MMITEYKESNEKEAVFADGKYKRIESVAEFNDWYKQNYKVQQKVQQVFRGVNNAKYKLYTSLQRLWAERKLDDLGYSQKDCICKMLSQTREKEDVLTKYCKALGINDNDWFRLSFLQHYGAASPLLDFSKSIHVALYFACMGVTYNPYADKGNLNNYISVYYYKVVDAAQDVASLSKIAATLGSDISKYQEKLSFKNLTAEHEVLIIPTYTNPISVKKRKKGNIVHTIPVCNMNSVAQLGEFVCNVKEREPLEEVLRKDINDASTGHLHCVDIHKGLVDYIINEKLGGLLETARKKYFPSEEDIAHNAMELITKNL